MSRPTDIELGGSSAYLATPVVTAAQPGQAGHGFINRLSAASPLTPMLKIAGVGYDHDAAADAKRRILAFFEAQLRSPLPPRGEPSVS